MGSVEKMVEAVQLRRVPSFEPPSRSARARTIDDVPAVSTQLLRDARSQSPELGSRSGPLLASGFQPRPIGEPPPQCKYVPRPLSPSAKPSWSPSLHSPRKEPHRRISPVRGGDNGREWHASQPIRHGPSEMRDEWMPAELQFAVQRRPQLDWSPQIKLHSEHAEELFSNRRIAWSGTKTPSPRRKKRTLPPRKEKIAARPTWGVR